MPQDELSGPDLDGIVADANAVGLPYVVIGGFGVIVHGYLRATKDSDLLVPDGPETDEAIVRFLERVQATRLRDGKILSAEDVTGAHHLRVNTQGRPA
jgi:tRNA-binding EMAP/Myf-like protein